MGGGGCFAGAGRCFGELGRFPFRVWRLCGGPLEFEREAVRGGATDWGLLTRMGFLT